MSTTKFTGEIHDEVFFIYMEIKDIPPESKVFKFTSRETVHSLYSILSLPIHSTKKGRSASGLSSRPEACNSIKRDSGTGAFL